MVNPLKFIVCFVWGITLICALLLGASLTGFFNIFSIDTKSTSFGNWAMWFSAISTISTLIFLIAQNRSIRARQDINEAEDRKLKQAQYIEIRKKDFYNLLSDLESDAAPNVSFTSKLELYSSIYPRKQLKTNSNGTQYDTSCSLGLLRNLEGNFLKLSNTIEQLKESTNKVRLTNDFFKCISDIQKTLNLRFEAEPSYGDIQYRDSTVVNIFDIQRDLNRLVNIANHLNRFTDRTFVMPEIFLEPLAEDYLKYTLLKTSGVGGFSVNLPLIDKSFVKVLNKAYKLMWLDRIDNDTSFDCITILGPFFWRKDYFIDNVDDASVLEGTLNTVLDDLLYVKTDLQDDRIDMSAAQEFAQLEMELTDALNLIRK